MYQTAGNLNLLFKLHFIGYIKIFRCLEQIIPDRKILTPGNTVHLMVL